MIEYEERHNEICAIGCYFEDDRIFKDFLDAIEKLEGKETNYYNTLIRILKRIVYHNFGVPLDPTKKDGKKTASLPIVGGKNIKVIFQIEEDKDSKAKRYEILGIEIYENATLKEWAYKRYSSKK